MGENQEFTQPELAGIDNKVELSYEQLPGETPAEYEARKEAAGKIEDTGLVEKAKANSGDRKAIMAALGIKPQEAAAAQTPKMPPMPGNITRGDVDRRGKSDWNELNRIEHLLAELQSHDRRLADPFDGALYALLRSVITNGDANVRNLHKLFVSSTSDPTAEAAFRRAVEFVQHSSQDQRLGLLSELERRLKIARGELPADPVQLTLPVLPGEPTKTDNQSPQITSIRPR